MKTPKVTLIDWTRSPGAVLYVAWHQSRTTDPLLTVEEVDRAYEDSKGGRTIPARFYTDKSLVGKTPFYAHVDQVVDLVIRTDFPLQEMVQFTFVVEDMSVSLRDQLVRHRYAAIWARTSRITDLREFYDNGDFFEPKSVAAVPSARTIYRRTLQSAAKAYEALRLAGINEQDARHVLPTARTSRLAFTANLRSLTKIVSKRTCFVAQAELWVPVLTGMRRELATKVDPRLARIFYPPCFKPGSDEWVGCPYDADVARRCTGDDPLPPCPVWVRKHKDTHPGAENVNREERVAQSRDFVGVWGSDFVAAHVEDAAAVLGEELERV